jgi:phosphatidylglycerol:prolipoprotein diacylglycerol transferase
MPSWNNIYDTFNPVAFHIFSLPVHWYGIMYVLALLTALYIGKYFMKKDKLDFTSKQVDIYFIYVEIGVILGAISFFMILKQCIILQILGKFSIHFKMGNL